LTAEEVSSVMESFQIDPQKAMILQVSRFDRFKDPWGVIKAFQIAKQYRPDIQLVLAGGGATDDPEGAAILSSIQSIASSDKDIHVLFLPPDANKTINALQRGASIVMQKSIKEGFGLTITEALWKSKPVIGGNTGGIKLQVFDYHTGFLVNSPEGAANRIRYFLEHPHEIDKMGKTGHSFVKEHFLMTRHIKDYLTLLVTLAQASAAANVEL
jgi:trehalose synthase